MTTPNKSERNQDAIMNLMRTRPLLTKAQIASALALSAIAVHGCLTDLLRRGLVVRRSLCGADRYTERWWLSYAGLMNQRAKRFRSTLLWPSVEQGVEYLIGRMPVVAYLYDLAASLSTHPGILADGPVQVTPDLLSQPVTFTSGTTLGEFIWFENQPIDAVLQLSNRAWFALKWVGPEMPVYRLMRQADSIDDWLTRVVDSAKGPPSPTGWVLLCANRAIAAKAAEVWPGDNVLVVDVDGRVEQSMRPADFTLLLRHRADEPDPGEPERLGRRSNGKDPVQQAPNSSYSYHLFRFIAQWGFATRAQLRRKFGERYSKALGELQKLRLVGVSGEIVHLRERAVEVLSDIDRVDQDTVRGRVSRFVDLKRGTLRNPAHDTTLIDVFLKLEAAGLAPAEGSSHALYLPSHVQVIPDLVCCLDRKDRTLIVFVELELSASAPQQVPHRIRNYRDADVDPDHLTTSLWLVENHHIRRRYAEAGRHLVMLTATVDEFLSGNLWVPDGPCHYDHQRVSIDELAYLMDTDTHTPEDSPDRASDDLDWPTD